MRLRHPSHARGRPRNRAPPPEAGKVAGHGPQRSTPLTSRPSDLATKRRVDRISLHEPLHEPESSGAGGRWRIWPWWPGTAGTWLPRRVSHVGCGSVLLELEYGDADSASTAEGPRRRPVPTRAINGSTGA